MQHGPHFFGRRAVFPERMIHPELLHESGAFGVVEKPVLQDAKLKSLLVRHGSTPICAHLRHLGRLASFRSAMLSGEVRGDKLGRLALPWGILHFATI